jgi:hypothetical protein
MSGNPGGETTRGAVLAAPCTLHGQAECLRCMPPDEYYRWQIAHDQIGLFHLPSYWALQRARLAAERERDREAEAGR